MQPDSEEGVPLVAATTWARVLNPWLSWETVEERVKMAQSLIKCKLVYHPPRKRNRDKSINKKVQ